MGRLLKRWRVAVAGFAVALLLLAGAVALALALTSGSGRKRAHTLAKRATPASKDDPLANDPSLRPHPRVSEPEVGVTADEAIKNDPNYQAAIARRRNEKPPSEAEIKRELKSLEAFYASHPGATLDLSSALLTGDVTSLTGFHTSIASTFTDFGLPVACGGVEGRNELGVAHRTLPCGTKVTFRYGGRAIRVRVIDRGPYIAGREWDLTGATAIALHFPGLGQIQWKIG